jgi:hypothetical protein
VSWSWRSSGTLATITPVRPPITKVTMKASTQSRGVSQRGLPLQIVAIQQKICTPPGSAIIMLAAV